jgi:hypothetical protein
MDSLLQLEKPEATARRGASGCFGTNGLMITSTPEEHFVHWKGMKFSDLLEAEDRLVAHLEPLPFQEGSPLATVVEESGDLKKSYDYNQEAIQYASTTRVPDASGEVLAAAQQLSQAGLEIPLRKAIKSSIQSTGDVALKSIQLQEGDSSKTAVIGAGLDEK